MKQRISRLETKEQVKNPYMVQGLLEPAVVAREMKSRLQAKTLEAIENLSEQALKNPFYSKKFAIFTCEKQIEHIKKMDKCHQRERRRVARKQALTQGQDINKLDFNDENILIKYGAPGRQLWETFETEDEELLSGPENLDREESSEGSFESQDLGSE